jgi:hypothetical protein
MVIVGVVQVHRKREKAYYFSALVSCIILVAFTFTFLNQILLAFATIIAAVILSAIVTPKVMNVFEREPLRERAPRGIEQNKDSALASQSFFKVVFNIDFTHYEPSPRLLLRGSGCCRKTVYYWTCRSGKA